MSDLEQKLTVVCESMESAKTEYEQSTQCLVEALTGIHQRLEYIEKWIENQQRANLNL